MTDLRNAAIEVVGKSLYNDSEIDVEEYEVAAQIVDDLIYEGLLVVDEEWGVWSKGSPNHKTIINSREAALEAARAFPNPEQYDVVIGHRMHNVTRWETEVWDRDKD